LEEGGRSVRRDPPTASGRARPDPPGLLDRGTSTALRVDRRPRADASSQTGAGRERDGGDLERRTTVSVERPTARPPWPGEAGARRLLGLVRDACAEADGLPACLEAGLRAALTELAADPDLASLLTVDSHPAAGPAALDAQRRWLGRFGALLRDAAAADPRASHEPVFLAPFLIGGVRFQIGRLVLKGEAADLLRLLPGTLEALLAYYFEPGEPRALARAALGSRD
jgi:hypothetical protein